MSRMVRDENHATKAGRKQSLQHPVMILCVCVAAVIVGVTAASGQTPDRSGFTILATMGVGLQQDDILDESEVGLGGLNLGIGGFLSPDFALMFRVSGTNVRHDIDGFEFDGVSGVGGVAGQYWVNDRFNVEVGVGWGFLDYDPGGDDRGAGVILGTGYSIVLRTKHSLQLGVEYAPAFADDGNIHNLSINLGYQFL